MLILILPSSRSHIPCMRRPHCRPKAARSKLTPTLLNPYLFRKVIRKPKPMKIMTWTSWNTAGRRREVSPAADFLTEPCFVVGSPTLASAKRGHEIQSDETLLLKRKRATLQFTNSSFQRCSLESFPATGAVLLAVTKSFDSKQFNHFERDPVQFVTLCCVY